MVTLIIILATVAVSLLCFTGSLDISRLMFNAYAVWHRKEGYRLLTSGLVHGGWGHLFFNMLALLMFGRVLERMLGTREFLLFYFLCGILGGVVSYVFYLIQGAQLMVVMGASGSIYAMLFLSAVLFPTSRVLLFFIIPMKMPYAVLLYIAIEVFSMVYGLSEGVAHLIHLSCVAIAWLYVVLRFRLNPIKVWRDAL